MKRLRKLIRVARQTAASMRGLCMQGLTVTDAERLIILWTRRAELLGPFETSGAAHKLDYWAQRILAELQAEEDALFKRYRE